MERMWFNSAMWSHLVATMIASAVIPIAIANAYFMPKHLLPPAESDHQNLLDLRAKMALKQ
jgi:hypothetical protein